MYEPIVKYVRQGLECIKQEINPICAKFHIFLKIIKWVPFPEKEQVSFLSILAPTIAQVSKYMGKATACALYAISHYKM